MDRQGPHQVAQKSIKTGVSELVRDSKEAVIVLMVEDLRI